MDYELLQPWIIVGGYALACSFLILGQKAQERSPRQERTLFGVAGFVASATTFYWFSRGIPPLVLTGITIGFAAAVFLLLRWRKKRQASVQSRAQEAGRRGRCSGDRLRLRMQATELRGVCE